MADPRHLWQQWKSRSPWTVWMVEMGLLLAFPALLFWRETAVLHAISPEPSSGLETNIHAFLAAKASPLPAFFWRLAVPLAPVALALLLLRRRRWYFLAIAGCAASLLLMGDRVYHQFFSSILTLNSFVVFHQLLDIRASVGSALPLGELFVSLAFLLFAIPAVLEGKGAEAAIRPPRMMAADKISGLVLLLLAGYAGYLAFFIPSHYAIVDMNEQITIYRQKPTAVTGLVPTYESSHREFATIFGIFNFHLKNVADAIADLNEEAIKPDELTAVSAMLEHKYALNRKGSPYFGMARGRNVFLISLESFQHFLLGLEVDGRFVTPTLNGLRSRSLVFDHFVDQVKLGGTSDAEFSLMTGLLPDVRKIASVSAPADNDFLALPAWLADHGYNTFSFHGYRASFWNRNINHPRFGIQRMYFEKAFRSDEVIGLGLPDESFFGQTLDLLKHEDKPLMAFLISLSSHHPYINVPDSHLGYFHSFDEHNQAARYLRLARYCDDALGVFLSQAREAGFWEDSLFVIYGDHVAPMDDAGVELIRQTTGLDIRSPREQRIPMFLFMPGVDLPEERQTVETTIGGLQDIFPTVCHLLGMDIPYGLYGTHLFVPNAERDPVPVLRKGGHFFYNDIRYAGPAGQPVEDEAGLIYGPHENLLPPGRVRSEKYASIVEQLTLGFLFIDKNAQARAVAAREAAE